MSYDDYITGDDKPFAENINDALLISNVFDFMVPIELPKMFSNSTWVNSASERKAGVSIVSVAQMSDITITTDSGGNSVLSCDGSGGVLDLKFYPNFNSFGKIRKVSWVSDSENIGCSIEDDDGIVIVSDVGNGASLSDLGLTVLQEYHILFSWTGADVLSSIRVEMENKQQTRYGANVKIQSVDGLVDSLDIITDSIYDLDEELDGKVDKVTGKQLSTNDYTAGDKSKVDNLKPVATTGSYTDLNNKPNIPTKTSDLTNDGDGTNAFVKDNDSRLTDSRNPTAHSHGNVSNDGKIGSTSGKIVVTGINGVLQGADTITKSKISDFSHTHTKSEITDFSHTHTKSQISDFSHTHTKTDISDFPSTMPPSSHTHGDLTNDGKISISPVEKDTSDFPIVADDSDSKKLKRGYIYTGFVWDNYARPNIGTAAQATQTSINAAIDTVLGTKVDTTDSRLSNATGSSAGLMSANDKSKLDGVATGATKNIVDSALSSSSTNAVQNKVITTALGGKADSSELEWKVLSLTDMNGCTLRYNSIFCVLTIYGTYTLNVANEYTNLVSGVIPSEYCPDSRVTGISDGGVLVRFRVSTNGTVSYYTPQTISSSGYQCKIIWERI